MSSPHKSEFQRLVEAPWWVSIVIGVAVYWGLRYGSTMIDVGHPRLDDIISRLPGFAWVAWFFLIPAGMSAYRTYKGYLLVDRQTGLGSIRELSWNEFKRLVCEAYRRDGYVVRENHTDEAGEPVDLTIRKDGNTWIVQCKQWLNEKVDVYVVREMFGVMHHEKANGVIILTTGIFTQEAKTFAKDKPIDLIEGQQLANFIRSVRKKPLQPASLKQSGDAPLCPRCGSALVVRTAKKGNNPATKVLACSAHPECKYLFPLDE